MGGPQRHVKFEDESFKGKSIQETKSLQGRVIQITLVRKVQMDEITKWLERLTANAEVVTVLCSIPASSDTVESEGRQMKQC